MLLPMFAILLGCLVLIFSVFSVFSVVYSRQRQVIPRRSISSLISSSA